MKGRIPDIFASHAAEAVNLEGKRKTHGIIEGSIDTLIILNIHVRSLIPKVLERRNTAAVFIVEAPPWIPELAPDYPKDLPDVIRH